MNAIILAENIYEKMRMLLFSVVAILVMSFIIIHYYFFQKVSSRSHRTDRFVFTNCFDMGYGTAACLLKEIIKLYLYYIRAVYVHNARAESTEKALKENLSKSQDLDRAVAAALEGLARCIGTFIGAYGGGIVGGGKVGWLGFVAGSQLGSWIGGRIGLMAYDVWNGVQYLLH
ncbi:hypothetical protein DH2020_046130 [Rehmannia glutinosa]|uniref:Uncharacterized protein n=1 Tax=Rehmannia glutinosa TaxID=99300 RepID=A0ABR0UC75_REHGL